MHAAPGLANGYPPPPGPYPFASPENAPVADWAEPVNNGGAAPYSEFAPVGSAYPPPAHDLYSADTLFGAAPMTPDTTPTDMQAVVPPRDAAFAYPPAPYANGTAGGRPSKQADFSVDFKRDRRQGYEPDYGYPGADPQWHYPALPNADMPMTAPYPAEPPIDYRSTTTSPIYGTGYPDTAYAPTPVLDTTRTGQPQTRTKQDSAPAQAPAMSLGPVAGKGAGKAMGKAVDPGQFRPALEGSQ